MQRKDRGSGIRGVEDDVTRGSLDNQAQPLSRHGHVTAVISEERTTMQSLGHWLTELDEVYARHAGRHGPNRLLPAEVLPAHGHVPGHADAGATHHHGKRSWMGLRQDLCAKAWALCLPKARREGGEGLSKRQRNSRWKRYDCRADGTKETTQRARMYLMPRA
jgi:hypothetical protein